MREEDTVRLGQPDQLEDSMKQNTTYNKSLPYLCSTTRVRTWVNNNSHTPYLEKAIHLAPFTQDAYAAILYPYIMTFRQ